MSRGSRTHTTVPVGMNSVATTPYPMVSLMNARRVAGWIMACCCDSSSCRRRVGASGTSRGSDQAQRCNVRRIPCMHRFRCHNSKKKVRSPTCTSAPELLLGAPLAQREMRELDERAREVAHEIVERHDPDQRAGAADDRHAADARSVHLGDDLL